MPVLLSISTPLNVLDAVENDTLTTDPFALPANATLVEWQTVFATAPGSVDIDIETSLDGDNWEVAATTTDTSGDSGNFPSSAVFIRIVVNAISGGSTMTVILIAKMLSNLEV